MDLPFKDQEPSNSGKKRFKDFSLKLQITIQPVFVRRKIDQKRQSRILLTNKVPSIVFSVAFVVRVMWVIRAGTYTNVVEDISNNHAIILHIQTRLSKHVLEAP